MHRCETRTAGYANGFKQTAGSPVSPLAYNVPLIAAVFVNVIRYLADRMIFQGNELTT